MKKKWPKIKLKEIAEIRYGFTESAFFDKIGPKFLRITDIQNGNVNWKNVPYCKIDNSEINKYLLVEGDIVFARTGATTGKSYLIGSEIPKSVFASYLIRVQINNDFLSPHFLYYFFQTDEYWNKVSLGTSGSAQGGVNATKLGGFQIPIPPLPEQKRIVGILDKAFTAIAKAKANAEQNLKSAKELFESYLQGVFEDKGEGWEEKKFEELCNLITCGVAATPKYVDESEGVPFLSAQNVRDGEVVLDKYRFISKQFHQDLTKKNKPSKGDILYSRVGAKFGEAGVVEHDFEFSVYVSLTLIKPKPDKLINYYLKYYLNSPFIKNLAKKSISSSGVPNLNVKEVRRFPIKCPSISIQKKIVNEIKIILAETKKLEAIYQKKIDDLEELKKSVLQKAFNGEL